MEMVETVKNQISQLPKSPGVYFFKNTKGEVMYIGKATSLRDRVRSYWAKELNRGPGILAMVEQIAIIDHLLLDSGLEALIAEANLIKKHMPKYNIKLRDDKSYFYVKLDNTDQSDFPRLSMVHKNEILRDEKDIRYFGPYTSGKQLRIALKTIRKIFPYRSCVVMPKKPCLQYHIKRCEAPCVGLISKQEYKSCINAIILLLEGKKERLIKQLKRAMEQHAKRQEFEQAAAVRNQYIALQHLHTSAKISDIDPELDEARVEKVIDSNIPRRIEGYDVSNLNGKEAAVSMVTFLHGKPAKKLYKRFKIKTVIGPNDYAMLQEAIDRRLHRAKVSTDGAEDMINERTWEIVDNEEWQLPDIMVIDGGRGQITAVEEVMRAHEVHIPLIGMAKGPTRKGEDLYFSGRGAFRDVGIIRAVRDEAHRFAGAYHRVLRSKQLIKSELDDIAGIGQTRKKALYKRFGSVEGIKHASFDDIAEIIGESAAQKIKQYFKN